MGGSVPIGHDLDDWRLVVNNTKANAVHHIFRRYTLLKSVPQLVDELAADGFQIEPRLCKGETIVGNMPFRAGWLTKLFHNPVQI